MPVGSPNVKLINNGLSKVMKSRGSA